MLTQLTIANYAIADRVDLDFGRGMLVITGETGAGKSITLGALGLALGDRADSRAVGSHCDRAEIHAGFDLSHNAAALAWLREHELSAGSELLLRRVIHADGRSRAYINGKPATLADLRQLGQHLVDIHGQHDHQTLLKRDRQRSLLDAYAGARELGQAVAEQVRACSALQSRIDAIVHRDREQSARVQLLRYQAEELQQLNLQDGEPAQLEREQTALAHAEQQLALTGEAMDLCSGNEHSAANTLLTISRLLAQLPARADAVDEAAQLLDSARIQVEEAEQSLRSLVDGAEADPGRLQQTESRLSDIYRVARKHRLPPGELPALLESLSAELAELDCNDDRLAELQAQLVGLCERRDRLAGELSQQRQRAGARLAGKVNKLLKQLSMAHCRFEVHLAPLAEVGLKGGESVEFRISTQPGRPARPIHDIASGGELSRIGLALQVAASHLSGAPTLIFDEVDAGIGGGIAEVVGSLLRKLSEHCQVFCITHLAQVACQGDHHFVVARKTQQDKVLTRVECLTDDAKTAEIARMLGGIAITDQTRAHAREMLATHH